MLIYSNSVFYCVQDTESDDATSKRVRDIQSRQEAVLLRLQNLQKQLQELKLPEKKTTPQINRTSSPLTGLPNFKVGYLYFKVAILTCHLLCNLHDYIIC